MYIYTYIYKYIYIHTYIYINIYIVWLDALIHHEQTEAGADRELPLKLANNNLFLSKSRQKDTAGFVHVSSTLQDSRSVRIILYKCYQMFSLISSSSVRCFHSASIYSRAAFSSPQHSSGKSTVRKTKDNVPVIYFLAFVEAACSLLVWRADGQAGLPRGLNQAVPGIIGLSHEKK